MRKSCCINSKLLVVICLFLIACDGVFVPDPIDPRVPKYTEEGNNVAGAFIDDDIWKSIVTVGFPYVYDGPIIKVWQENDSLLLRFSGSTSGESTSIEFHLTGLNITKFDDLLTLDGKKIQLDGFQNSGYYIENYTPSTYDNRGIGQIYFRNVCRKEESSIIILSGTFGFSISDLSGYEMKVTSGRFDYRIGESSSFYVE